MIPVEEAKARLVAELAPCIERRALIGGHTERVSLLGGLGRILACDIVSPVNLPGFPKSTVDGFAVTARDTFGASDSLPSYVELAGEVRIGESPATAGGPGRALRIPTGGMLPAAHDAVVMLEYADEPGDGTIEIRRAVVPGENVMEADEDVRKGEILMKRGRPLRPQDLGALGGIGMAEVPVAVKPTVALISTGDEIVPPGDSLAPGKVYDINSYSLASLVAEAGGVPLVLGVIGDRFDELLAAARDGLERSELLVICGGSSVGTRDHTLGVIEALSQSAGRIFVHGLAIRPGKPCLMATTGDKLIFGLPGHPVSAMTTFRLFVLRAIHALLGVNAEAARTRPITARLARNLPSASGRDDFYRVRLVLAGGPGEFVAEPILSKSGAISSMVRAHGLVRVPSHRDGILEGETVEVELI